MERLQLYKTSQLKVAAIVFLFSFFIPENGKAQCYFMGTYDFTDGHESAYAVHSNGDDGIWIGGTINWPTTDSAFAMHTDSCGTLLSSKKYLLSPDLGGENPATILPYKEGKHVIFGSQYDHGEGALSSFMLEVNEVCDSISHHIISAGYNDNGKSMIYLGNGESICAGNYNSFPPDTNAGAFLMKVDSFGNILWKQKYGGYYYQVQHIDRMEDDAYVVSGRVSNPQNGSTDLFLLKTDTIGNLIWKKFYGDNQSEQGGYAICVSGGGFIQIGTHETMSAYELAVVNKTDSNGALQWQRFYGSIDSTLTFRRAVETADGGYLLAGTLTTYDINSDTIKFYLSKINAQGHLIWEHSYSYNNAVVNLMWDMAMSLSQDVILVGSVNPIVSENSVLIIKTDSCGYTVGDTVESAAFTFTPSEDNLTIEFTNLSTGYCKSD